jgi:hypothetical protein
VRVLFVSDTHFGFDVPAAGASFVEDDATTSFRNFERALEPARTGEVESMCRPWR